MAPWFGGLDARYAAIGQRALGMHIDLVGTDAGLTRPVDHPLTLRLSARLATPRALTGFLIALRRLPGKADLAVLDDTWDPRFILLWLLKSRRRALVVHDARPHDLSNDHKHRWQRWLKAWGRRHTTHVICFSRHVAKELDGTGQFPKLSRVDVITLLPEFAARPDGATPAARYFLMPGRFSEYKNVPLVLEAWGLLPASIRDHYELRLAGAGSRMAGTTLPSGVSINDRRLDEGELAQLIAGATAVLVCYTQASQSGISSLASALGVPVITTPVGGLSEYQPSTELIAATPEQVVDAICAVISSGTLHRKRAAAFSAQRFAASSVARELQVAWGR
ncbi:MAG: glycosyltransferase family 4 protein [Actinomycetota bacterium]|nr:glycosyltransferase family 4 protein [Actinomycetota bacterium]